MFILKYAKGIIFRLPRVSNFRKNITIFKLTEILRNFLTMQKHTAGIHFRSFMVNGVNWGNWDIGVTWTFLCFTSLNGSILVSYLAD